MQHRSTMRITAHPLSTAPTLPHGVTADESLIKRLQESFRPLLDSQPSLAERFYAQLFAAHPQLRSMFPRDMENQKRKLLEMLNLIIENLRAPQTVLPALKKLGVSHVGYGARPEHYPIVARTLIGAIAELSGPRWTADVEADWSSALKLVTQIMVEAARNGAESGGAGA